MEGPHLVADAITAGARVREIFMAPDAPASEEVVRLAGVHGVTLHHAGDAAMDVLTETTTPQGVVAVVDDVAQPLDRLLAGTDLVLVLASVTDPGNAGTLVRSAAAAGAGAVVFATGSVDPLGPKTVRASSGALFKVGIARGVALEAAVSSLRDAGFRVLGAQAGAARDVTHVDLSGKVALVVGNEAWGLTADLVPLLDDVVGIGMPGDVESLNVAIAGSILLFEVVRQRGVASVS